MLREGSFQIAFSKFSIIIFILISRCERSSFLYVGFLRAMFPKNKILGDYMFHTPESALHSKMAWVISLFLPAATYSNRPVQPLLDVGQFISHESLTMPFSGLKRKDLHNWSAAQVLWNML